MLRPEEEDASELKIGDGRFFFCFDHDMLHENDSSDVYELWVLTDKTPVVINC